MLHMEVGCPRIYMVKVICLWHLKFGFVCDIFIPGRLLALTVYERNVHTTRGVLSGDALFSLAPHLTHPRTHTLVARPISHPLPHSVQPCSLSQRSASSAACAPEPALVTAWR